MVTWKKPFVDAIRHTIERLERDRIVSADDPMLTRLKRRIVLRIIERDDSPPAELDDLKAKSAEDRAA